VPSSSEIAPRTKGRAVEFRLQRRACRLVRSSVSSSPCPWKESSWDTSWEESSPDVTSSFAGSRCRNSASCSSPFSSVAGSASTDLSGLSKPSTAVPTAVAFSFVKSGPGCRSCALATGACWGSSEFSSWSGLSSILSLPLRNTSSRNPVGKSMLSSSAFCSNARHAFASSTTCTSCECRAEDF